MGARRRRGITGTLEQALLIAVTLAFFLGIVVTPMANAAKFVWDMPQKAWDNWSSFVDWVDGLIGSVFSSGSSSGTGGTSGGG